MKKLWLLAVVGLLTAVFALGAVACSSDDDEDDGNGGQPTAMETPGAPTAAETAGQTPSETSTGETPGGQGGFTTLVVNNGIVTTYDGYTVYTYDNDSADTSTCTGDCANTWPPLPTVGEPTGGEGVTGDLGTITRDDGITQVTLDGKPLYMYSGDPSPGDTNGDGSGGVWHVVSAD